MALPRAWSEVEIADQLESDDEIVSVRTSELIAKPNLHRYYSYNILAVKYLFFNMGMISRDIRFRQVKLIRPKQ